MQPQRHWGPNKELLAGLGLETDKMVCYTQSHKGQQVRIYLTLEASVGVHFPIFYLKDVQVDIKVEVRAEDWLSGKVLCIACTGPWDSREREQEGGEHFSKLICSFLWLLSQSQELKGLCRT